MSDRDEWSKIERNDVQEAVVLAQTDLGGQCDWAASIGRAIQRLEAAAAADPCAASESIVPDPASATAGAAQSPPTASSARVSPGQSASAAPAPAAAPQPDGGTAAPRARPAGSAPAPTAAPVCPPPAPATLEEVTALAITVCPRTRHLPPDPDICLRDTSRVAQSCSLRHLDLPPHLAGRLVRLDLTDNELTAEEVQPLHSTAPWLRVLDITANNVRAALTALPPKLLSLSLAHNPLGSVEGPLLPPSQRLRSLSLEGCGLRSIVDAGGRSQFGGFPALLMLNVRRNELKDPAELASLADTKRLEDLAIAGRLIPGCMGGGEETAAVPEARGYAEAHGDTVAEAVSRSVAPQLGEDRASCSCKEGNPCAVPYNCADWEHRFQVAEAARKERYDQVF